jgi:DNA-binding IclR family transcriptional regulator
MSADEPDGHTQRVNHVVDPRLSRSFEYGVAMLECFSAARPVLRISELADMIEMSRSTTHRYAMTLVALGNLEQDDKRRYRLTHHAALPGMALIDTIRLEIPAAATILEDLREETGHTVSMGVLDGTRVLYIHRLFAHGAGQYEADLGLGVGAHVPAHCTAIGKALLASLGEDEQSEILARLTLTRHGPKTLASKRELVVELARFRPGGMAVCDEEQATGVRSIAVAILNSGESRPMAVSVTVPAREYTMEMLRAQFGFYVAMAANRICASVEKVACLKARRAREVRTREIVSLAEAKELTRQEIGERYGISRQRISQIVDRARRSDAPDDG